MVQAILALGTVADGAPFEVDFDGNPGWVHPVRTDTLARVAIKPLLKELRFASNSLFAWISRGMLAMVFSTATVTDMSDVA